jgi:ribosomal protein S18 acetylase RimI-like enzyme
MATTVELRRGSLTDLPALEPLWGSVRRGHGEYWPYLDDGQTWAQRKALYTELLAKPDSVLFLASDIGSAVGYAFGHVVPVSQSCITDARRAGPRIGEIESLVVLPSHRRRGIGGRLLDALAAELAAGGIHDLVLGVLPGNAQAIAMYERRGFRPAGAYLSRFHSRESP